MKTQKTTKQNTIDEKVRTYFAEEQALLKKLGLSKRLVVLFPRRLLGAPSFFGSLLLTLLRSQGGVLDTEFSLKDK